MFDYPIEGIIGLVTSFVTPNHCATNHINQLNKVMFPRIITFGLFDARPTFHVTRLHLEVAAQLPVKALVRTFVDENAGIIEVGLDFFQS